MFFSVWRLELFHKTWYRGACLVISFCFMIISSLFHYANSQTIG